MSALVYQAINAVAAELCEVGIAKAHRNEEGNYEYRSIDDVLAALSPLLARHKLCVLPRVLQRESIRCGRTSQLVTVHAAYDLVSALDGSIHSVESFGEAIDDSDKGTAKATSGAFKSAMLQAFCIPTGEEDADAKSPRLNSRSLNGATLPEPPEGWESWAAEVVHIAKSCESAEAIDRLTSTRRPMLAALQHSRPELYAGIGEAIAARLAKLQKPTENVAPAAEVRRGKAKRRPGKETDDASREPAKAA